MAKCGYCSFYSLPVGGAPDKALVALYLEALSAEIASLRGTWGPFSIKTLYVGGGTPSLLSLQDWESLLRVLASLGDLSVLREATVEANPCSLREELTSLWRSSFMTRISLGVQSLDDGELRVLGRLHDAQTALQALERAVRSGLETSADLIFGIPGQTLGSWKRSLSLTLCAGVSHISAYQLTLEPDAPMSNRAPDLPDGYPFYRYAQWYLPRKGFRQYEISNFAMQGYESWHNLAYWRHQDVLALGPAAWGYWGGLRYRNAETLELYLEEARQGFPLREQRGERLSKRAQGIEAAILALRTSWGIPRAGFAAAWGNPMLHEIERFLREEVPSHCVFFDEEKITLTAAGMRVGNAIWAGLLGLGDG
ncbi:MAG: radical SAM family heme chaperone HemW [Fretibacterium sp.]|nr:radical SAM family heme chaperone HemW [Fretibacterium sp.]